MAEQMHEKVKLSIVCITYNHERFIRDCLEGFVMQNTDFPFEILINDDASTDATADIIREYEAKYPHLFRCVYQTENQSGKKCVWSDILFPMIRGEYVAFCDGDDYWTDPLKLQKQVEFLDKHPAFSVCFHPVTVHWDNNSLPDSVFPDEKGRFYKTELHLDDLLYHNFIQTTSVVYRWRFHHDSLALLPKGILPLDWFVHLLHAQVGKIGFIPDIMAVYRRNQGGIWTGAFEKHEWFVRFGIPSVRFYLAVDKQFGADHKEVLDKTALLTYLHLQKDGKDSLIKELFSYYEPPLAYLHYPCLQFLFCSIALCFCFGELRKSMLGRLKILGRVIAFQRMH